MQLFESAFCSLWFFLKKKSYKHWSYTWVHFKMPSKQKWKTCTSVNAVGEIDLCNYSILFSCKNNSPQDSGLDWFSFLLSLLEFLEPFIITTSSEAWDISVGVNLTIISSLNLIFSPHIYLSVFIVKWKVTCFLSGALWVGGCQTSWVLRWFWHFSNLSSILASFFACVLAIK